MKNQTAKKFDCLAFKNKVQNDTYRKFHGLSAEQRIAFFHHEVMKGPFGEWLAKKIKNRAKKKTKVDR